MSLYGIDHHVGPLSFWQGLRGFLLSLVAGTLVTVWMTVSNFRGVDTGDLDLIDPPLEPLLWGMTVTVGFQLLWVIWLTMDRPAPAAELGLRLSPLDMILGPATWAAAAGGGYLLVEYVLPIFADVENGAGSGQFPDVFVGTPESHILWLFLVVGLAVPLAEELLFRGVMLLALETTFGLTIAILGTSLLFGVFHAPTVSSAALPAVVWATWAGLVFATVTIATIGSPRRSSGTPSTTWWPSW